MENEPFTDDLAMKHVDVPWLCKGLAPELALFDMSPVGQHLLLSI
jgi:hypothetical protein